MGTAPSHWAPCSEGPLAWFRALLSPRCNSLYLNKGPPIFNSPPGPTNSVASVALKTSTGQRAKGEDTGETRASCWPVGGLARPALRSGEKVLGQKWAFARVHKMPLLHLNLPVEHQCAGHGAGSLAYTFRWHVHLDCPCCANKKAQGVQDQGPNSPLHLGGGKLRVCLEAQGHSRTNRKS